MSQVLTDSRTIYVSLSRRSASIWLGLSLLLAASGCKPTHPIVQFPPPPPHPIHGYVFAATDGGVANEASVVVARAGAVALPDIIVVAKNVGNGLTSTPVKTDPYGYFRTPAVTEGRYQICVSGTGFLRTCDPQIITITNQMHVMDHIVVAHISRSAVIGTVQLADKKTPCFWYDPTFDANFVMTAQVSLVDGSGTVFAGPIRGNNRGEYVMPVSAASGNYTVKVDCEAAQASNAVTLNGGVLAQNFVLNNHSPTANLLEAKKAGLGVRRASPGDALAITVPAADLDHNFLHFKWVDDSGLSGSFADASTVNWAAPAPGGVHSLRVLVSDGHGGYAISRTQINVGADAVHFSGVAFNRATHAPVADAAVTLNGVATSTDTSGHFQVDVPDATRFVLNAAKPAFALTSRIFYTRAVNIQLPMDQAQSIAINGASGGKGGVRVTGCVVTGEGAQAAARSKDCERQTLGTLSFAFGPKSLVLGATPFNGLASVEAFQFDLSQANAIPGDQSGTFHGAASRLQTFGAFHIQPRDAAGHALQMAPGKSVAVSMPIHPLALATAPAKIPFFSYDETSGLWVEHGEMKRVGNNYVGKITHFSEFNADTAFTTSSCMKVQLEQGPQGFPASVILNATYDVSSVGNFNHPNTVITDTFNPIVIERLVPNQDFHLVIRDNSTNTILQNVQLNSGPPVTVPFPVPFPYDGCKPAVIFNNTSVPPTSDHFLVFGTITDNSADYKTQTTTGAYTGRDTFPHWLSTNGFGGGASEVNAVYFNNGDLKFGRSMHCRSVAPNGAFTQAYTACYVSNFGSVGLDFADQPANPLTQAYANTPVVATVAMEFHPDQANKVQFWAFKGNATGDYFPNPALDVEGNKPMPDICMGCHQGTGGGGGTLVNNAVFLTFDIDSFLGDDGAPLQNTIGTGAPRPTQEAFRQMNAFVLASTNSVNTTAANLAAQKLTDIWYKDSTHAGVNTAGATYHFNQGAAALNTNTPGSWATSQDLYDNVVRPVCRTCHVAAPFNSQSLTWDTLAKMTTASPQIQPVVCGPGNIAPHHTMPHAQVPYKRFWLDNLENTLGNDLGFTCSP